MRTSIDRVSTVTLDRTSTDYPRASYVAYTYPTLPVRGNGPTKKIVTVERGDVEITIDIEALVDWMGRRAMAAKSGKSVMQEGLIVARVIKREVISRDTLEVPLPEGCTRI